MSDWERPRWAWEAFRWGRLCCQLHPCRSLAAQDILSVVDAAGKGPVCALFALGPHERGVSLRGRSESTLHMEGVSFVGSSEPLLCSSRHTFFTLARESEVGPVWIRCGLWAAFTARSLGLGVLSLSGHPEVARKLSAPGSSTLGLFGSKSQTSYHFYL